MSLNNIQLPSFTLQGLYKRSLVDLEPAATKTKQKNNIVFLGNNKKRIAIVVSNDEAMYLPDDELNFLMGILSACKLTMEDVAIINLQKNDSLTYQALAAELKAEKVLLFGVEPTGIELPIQFPFYQSQKYNDQSYLSAPILSQLQNDKAEKTKLWMCLKQVFGIV